MALDYSFGVLQWLTSDAATSTKTVSGLTFQPKALRFYWNGLQSATDALSSTVNGQLGMGAAVSTTSRRAFNYLSVNAAAAADETVNCRNDCVVVLSASVGGLDLNAINADGFQLIVDVVATQNVSVFWEAWGGSDITVAAIGDITEAAATGNVDYTVTGFVAGATDQMVMFVGGGFVGTLPASGTTYDESLMVGYATSGNAANNIVVVGNSDDGSSTMDTDGYCKTGECLAVITFGGGNPNVRAQLTQFNTDGFRLNWIAIAAAARKFFFLAMKGGSWTAGAYTIAGNTLNATTTVSGLAYTPKGVSLLGRNSAEQAAGTSVTQSCLGIGSGVSTTSRNSTGYLNEDATANAEIDTTIQYDQILSFPSATGTLQSAYDIAAMNSDGFQIIVDVAGGVASEWQGYLAFGNAGAPPSPYVGMMTLVGAG